MQRTAQRHPPATKSKSRPSLGFPNATKNGSANVTGANPWLSLKFNPCKKAASNSHRFRSGSKNQMHKQKSVEANKNIVSGHVSTTTALLQNPRSNASPSAATDPQTTRHTDLSLCDRCPKVSDSNTAPPAREIVAATKPHAIAAANAQPMPSRHAIFENGNTLITIHPKIAHTGWPDGEAAPGYIAAVASIPE